jgi:hypothetical protein
MSAVEQDKLIHGKPLGQKAYGSIPHLPGSRLGPGEHCVHEGQARIYCLKPRDRHDRVFVPEQRAYFFGSAVGRLPNTGRRRRARAKRDLPGQTALGLEVA